MLEKTTFLVGSKKFSAVLTGIVLLLLIPLIVKFVFIVLSESNENNKVEELVRDQENIALILIGIGSFLLGRTVLLKWLDDFANPEVELTDTCKKCEINGFFLIALGSFMEILDQLILHVEGMFEVGVILELIFNFPLDLLSTLILGKLFIYLAFDKTSSS